VKGGEQKGEEGRKGREYPTKGNPGYGPDRALSYDYKINSIFHPPSS